MSVGVGVNVAVGLAEGAVVGVLVGSGVIPRALHDTTKNAISKYMKKGIRLDVINVYPPND
ncbi:MAG: hypothetical protein DWQ07_01345 [Chloroflexi bacterium]|nr:MAG: hypothetical protein DWQ07_01345 [Chloroflexota bacterium]